MGPKKKTVGIALVLLAGALGVSAVFWRKLGEEAVRPQGVEAAITDGTLADDARAEAYLPAIQQSSKAVNADDLEFQIVSSTIWPMPAQIAKNPVDAKLTSGGSPVSFELRVTNRGKQAIQFLDAVGTPILKDADGQEWKAQHVGANHYCRPTVVNLEPGKTFTAKRVAQLVKDKAGLMSLSWLDETCGIWRTNDLKLGKYFLRLHYNARETGPSGVWLGNVQTAEVPIEIVDLKASQPVVVNGVQAASLPDGGWEIFKAEERDWKMPVEIRALADSIWKGPAADIETRVCLGFRVASVEPWRVRIIPSLATVHMRSENGRNFPARQTGATVPVGAPFFLALDPNFNRSVAYSAALFRAGKSLTLAWADGAGNVWNIDKLQPGRYSLHYVIRAEKGQPQPYSYYWLGDLQTAAVQVDIKE